MIHNNINIPYSTYININININIPHELLLTNRQVANLRKAFANYWSTDIKISKTQLSKMIQSGGFLGRPLAPLLKTGIPLAKNVLIQLEVTAAASAADAGIHTNILGPVHFKTTLKISDSEMEDIIKIVKSLEDSCLLLKEVSVTIQYEAKEQKKDFLVSC